MGRWKEWLRENFPYSDRTAQRFMEIAREEDLPGTSIDTNRQP
ncbi:DUF3102 domain-containing protein [Microcystis aeruginosa EAWAG127a]|uniref:DUF3102 domain-containing protein n=2 Tax=Microcystis aeruginosa TaxID=1126 RepID=A0A5J5M0J6_MICAE|nr:DUF3102 domain-containing protein [Microcystis aeruginosa EAWAG127a]